MSRIDELEAENSLLKTLLDERNASLYEALGALSGMWNQYCPPPWTHESMNAGEDAEYVLSKWKLIRSDESSIAMMGAQIDPDIPDIVLDLRKKSY